MASNFTARVQPYELYMVFTSSSYSREQQFKYKKHAFQIQVLTLILFASETTDQKSFQKKYLSAISRANASKNKQF